MSTRNKENLAIAQEVIGDYRYWYYADNYGSDAALDDFYLYLVDICGKIRDREQLNDIRVLIETHDEELDGEYAEPHTGETFGDMLERAMCIYHQVPDISFVK